MATTCHKLAMVMMAIIIIIISVVALSKQVSATLQILGNYVSFFERIRIKHGLATMSQRALLGSTVTRRSHDYTNTTRWLLTFAGTKCSRPYHSRRDIDGHQRACGARRNVFSAILQIRIPRIRLEIMQRSTVLELCTNGNFVLLV